MKRYREHVALRCDPCFAGDRTLDEPAPPFRTG